jgi:hypothetical protein
MNNVAFFLRNKLSENRFSASVLAALNTPSVDSALLCSGFFQEDASYSVSAKRFSAISRCSNKLDLTTVGYYGSGKTAYKDFLAGLNAHCCTKCINVKPLRLPGDKWHAKIFIAKQGGEPVVAAIGSSNLTRRAFDTLKNFNYECDVLFWDESKPDVSRAISRVLGEIPEDLFSVVVAKIDPAHPVNKVPVPVRLKSLEREICAKAKALA